jgi:hypothetical protein
MLNRRGQLGSIPKSRFLRLPAVAQDDDLGRSWKKFAEIGWWPIGHNAIFDSCQDLGISLARSRFIVLEGAEVHKLQP